MKYLELVLPNEAVSRVARAFTPAFSVETMNLALESAIGYRAAEDYTAIFDSPNYNKSTVDGYALRAVETIGAGPSMPSLFKIIGEVHMGQVFQGSLKAGEAVYVPTGGMLPAGSDAVLMIEDAELLDKTSLLAQRSLAVGDNVIYRAEDMRQGHCYLHRGEVINLGKVGALASMGLTEIKTLRKARAFVISTGDEIRKAGQSLSEAEVYDSNGPALKAYLLSLGIEVCGSAVIQDDPEALKSAFNHALSCSDIVILSGGSSVGERDYTESLFQQAPDAEIMIHGLAIKPGKPTIIGRSGEKLLLGLPGHPVSCLIVAQLLIPALLQAWNYPCPEKHSVQASLMQNIHGAPGKIAVTLLRLEIVNSVVQAEPLFGKSGVLSQLAAANAYLILNQDEEGVTAGCIREVYYL